MSDTFDAGSGDRAPESRESSLLGSLQDSVIGSLAVSDALGLMQASIHLDAARLDIADELRRRQLHHLVRELPDPVF